MPNNYVRVKPKDRSAFWAVRSTSPMRPDLIGYTRCNTLGVVGRTLHTYFYSRNDLEYEKTARINLKRGELEVVD